MIAGEQHALLFQKKAVVIADVTRRVNRLQCATTTIDASAVLQHLCRCKGLVLVIVAAGTRTDDLSAGRLGEGLPGRRMIRMGVRAENTFDASLAGREECIDMGIDGRTGIDYGYLVAADQVAVGPGSGHGAGIRRHQALHLIAEPLGLPGLQHHDSNCGICTAGSTSAS